MIVLLFVLACAIVFGLIFSLSFSSNGATSARYSSGAVTSAFVGLLSLVWLNDLLSRTTPSRRSGYEYLAALGVTVYLVLVAPYVFGALAGQASRYNDDPGSALPTVVVTADHPLDSSWTANGNDFISPTLRLLGRNSSFLVVWDPRHPDKSYSIPLAGIRTIERGH